MKTLALIGSLTWLGLWLTPDQQGGRLFRQGKFREAAAAFRDPMWQGTAWYRAGEFEKAAQAFARRNHAEALYNQGNAWLFRGKYDLAIHCYLQALEARPDWKEARENLAIARARAKNLASKGGDFGDQREGADEIVFDKDKPGGGQDTEINAGQASSEAAIQEMWLRRVQTRPADFLKAKFAWQHAEAREGEP